MHARQQTDTAMALPVRVMSWARPHNAIPMDDGGRTVVILEAPQSHQHPKHFFALLLLQ